MAPRPGRGARGGADPGCHAAGGRGDAAADARADDQEGLAGGGHIATRGTIRERGPQNPLLDDPFFRRFFDVPPDTGPRERPFQSAGSGVIVDAKSGYIVTNAHVWRTPTRSP